MNRILLGLVCCSPLLFSVPVQSVELIGPNDEVEIQQAVEATPVPTASPVAPINTPTKYGPIKNSETLWSIATQLRPNNNVSVYQTLAAIYKSNPSAFRQGDINKIIESSVINIPSPALIAQQSNAEAYALLKPTPKVNKPAPKELTIPTLEAIKTDVKNNVEPTFMPIDESNVEGLKKDLEDKEQTLTRNEVQVANQEKELALLSEQLIVATESNQRLKLKLQPLSDQIASLSEQVEEDIKVQKELQALIDQYKAQIDAIEEPPFSGPGILNTILRAISSSTSILIFAILFPLLLLTGIFLLILRLKSKRELALRQQELAESTAILSEDKSEFDTLLDDDLDIQPLPDDLDDSDFIVDTSMDDIAENSDDEISNNEESNIDELQEDITEQVNNVEEVVDTELIDDETPDIDENNDNELDFDLDAMIDGSDDVIDLSEADLNLEETDQSDLDLAAQWESELAQAEQENDTDELGDMEAALSESAEEPIELDLPEENNGIEDIDSLTSEADVEELPEVDEQEIEEVLPETIEEDIPTDIPTDVDELLESVEEDVTTDIDELLESIDEDVSTDVDELLESVDEDVTTDIDELLESVNEDVSTDVDELLDSVNEDVSTDVDELLESIDEDVIEQEAEPESIDEEIAVDVEELETLAETPVDADTLAKQLSDGAFNEDVALPSFDKNDDKGFIDIDTLLTGNESDDVTEEDFNLEFGLDEFPDVVDSFTEFDTDADGVAAQLDLAHAYLEIDEKEGAKTILNKLLETAPEDKLKEVKKLLARIS